MNAQIDCHTNCAKHSTTILPASYNVKKIFFTILFSLYLVLPLVGFVLLPSRVIGLLPLFLGLLALMLLSIRIRREHIPIYIFVGVLATSFLISSIIVGRTAIRVYVPFLYIVPSFGIAMILIRGYVYSWGGYIVFYSLAVYYFIFILTGTPALALTDGLSTNGISTAMLVACISLYIILRMENKKIDLIPGLLTLAISIWGIGVSGIISSFVLLLGLLFVRLRSKPKYIFIVLICLFVTYLFFDVLFTFVTNHWFFPNAIENFSSKMAVGNSARWPMWTNYFNNLDILRLISGVNVVEAPWPEGAANDYNYHNSFLHLHAQTGLVGLLTMVLIILAVFKYYRINKVFFILLLAFILRSSTDFFVFFNRFDFIYYFFIFYFLKSISFHVPHIRFLSVGTMSQKGNLK